MKHAAALLAVVILTKPALSDMSIPFHSKAPVWTTVTLSEPLPEYAFYAEGLPQREKWVPITFDLNKTTAIEALDYRGTRLIAVPRAFAEQFKTPDELRKAVWKENLSGVSSVELPKHLDVFTLDLVATTDHEVVIRRGPDGVLFDVVKEPRSSGSRWVCMGIGLLLAACAIFLGLRWARRRRLGRGVDHEGGPAGATAP